MDLAALERLKKNPIDLHCRGKRRQLFLIGFFSYLQVTRTYMKAWMSLNFDQIPPLTV